MRNDMEEQAEAAEVIGDYLKGTEGILTDLFQSGFATVHDGTLEELGAAAASGRQYGMTVLADTLEELRVLLDAQRHQARGENRQVYVIYGKLNQYLEICARRLEISRAACRLGIGGGTEDAESK